MNDSSPAPAKRVDTRKGDVALVIPTLNEERHIGALLAAMTVQAPDRVREIIVVDGGSTDATRTIVDAATDPRVRLLPNPARLQSVGVNRAAREASPDVTVLIRVDAHAHYPDSFVADLLAAHAESGAQSVVNRLRSVGVTPFQRAVAAASNSPFGTGGAAHRSGGAVGFIDHGHHALFDRATFVALGGYDEAFIANEDAEYDVRLRASGGRIWFTDTAAIDYFPRATPAALARQYFRYGQGRARTRAKHHERLRPRQMIPPLMVIGLAVALVASFLFPPALVVPAVYFLGVVAATGILMARTRDPAVIAAVLVLPIMHICWGWGFLSTLLKGRAKP